MGAALAAACDPWWVIGSAAAALHGARTPVADIDVLLSVRDAAALLPRLGLAVAAGRPDDRFRSEVFARWTGAALPIEFMAGLCTREGDAWAPVHLSTRVVVGGVAVPSRRELAALMRRFGRDKDLARAALLDAMP